MSDKDKKNSWQKFYPSDWRSDPKLRSCSLAARGLWKELLCIMHEADPHGHLVINGKPPSIKQIATQVGSTVEEVTPLLLELEENDVFSRNKARVIYSRRMVRDEKRRTIGRETGKMGGNPNLSKDKGKTATLNPQKLEARNQRLEKKDPPPTPRPAAKPKAPTVASDTSPGEKSDFERFWEAYPKRDGSNPKAACEPKFKLALKNGASVEEIIGGAQRYADEQRRLGKVGTSYIAQTLTWLNQQRWKDYPVGSGPGSANEHTEERVEPDSPVGQAWQKWTADKSIPTRKVDGKFLVPKTFIAKYGPGGQAQLPAGDRLNVLALPPAERKGSG